MNARNSYKVPLKQWRKWNKQARKVFNALYSHMIGSPWAFQSPAVVAMKLNKRQWNATAWNASWIAADAIMDAIPDYVQEFDRKRQKDVGRPRLLKAA